MFSVRKFLIGIIYILLCQAPVSVHAIDPFLGGLVLYGIDKFLFSGKSKESRDKSPSIVFSGNIASGMVMSSDYEYSLKMLLDLIGKSQKSVIMAVSNPLPKTVYQKLIHAVQTGKRVMLVCPKGVCQPVKGVRTFIINRNFSENFAVFDSRKVIMGLPGGQMEGNPVVFLNDAPELAKAYADFWRRLVEAK